MPLYDFKNTQTNEYEEHMVKISEYDDFLKENPQLERVFIKAPAFSYDGPKDILSKAGSEWNDVLKGVKEGMPASEKHKIETK